MKNYVVNQNYEQYTEDDHKVWQLLCKRQSHLNESYVSNVYLKGYDSLQINKDKIPKISKVSERLEEISGWNLIPVNGLLSPKDFFLLIINKTYPITASIRKRDELEFSEQPDIFHDICGHLPLLTNERFVNFLTAYSIIAIKYVKNERAIELLGRLYWYTYEMGLIQELNENKPYGGAILTSSKEIENIEKESVGIFPFDITHIFKTSYNPFEIQHEYFYINSFDELFLSLEIVEEKLLEFLLIPKRNNYLLNYSINQRLGTEFNNVIGFLNDTQFAYPTAISFVAGQPDEAFFDIESHLSKFHVYVDYLVKNSKHKREDIVNSVGQYGKTKGIINEIIAQYLKNDENISLSPEDILVTVGAQEAFSIIVSTICNSENDTIVVEDPSYIGVSSFAKVFNYDIEGVEIDEEGINLDMLKQKILDINRSEKKLKLVYVIPDHQNPTGSCMPIGSRLKLLQLAEEYNFLIIEDSVYNSFTYRQKKIPTLKSLDKFNRVIYVGSFSKSIFPGLRIGVIGSDQRLETQNGKIVPLIDQMTKVKAQITNNTSTISQAILGGILVDLDFSLSKYNEPKFNSYKIKLNKMLELLDLYVGTYSEDWASKISWNKPKGGFFIKMNVPFEVDKMAVKESAEKFGIIFCPMRFFYLSKGGENEIRLTFSNLSIEEIEKGIIQLSNYLKYKVGMKSTEIQYGKEEFANIN